MKSFIKTAIWNKDHYHHFGIIPTLAHLYGDSPENIHNINLRISEDQSQPVDNNPHVDYWGWFDFQKKDFTLIYPQKFLLNMCFTYGIKAEEDSGKGKAYRLEIYNTKK